MSAGRRPATPSPASEHHAPGRVGSERRVLGQLEHIHAQFANDEIDFEEFEAAKDTLIAQLAMG